MNIGIVGLGLIGGSLAKSAKKNTDYRVYGANRSRTVVDYALLSGIIDGELNEKTIKECDVIFISLYPESTVKYMEDNAKLFKKGAIVIDCAGIKRSVCEKGFELAAQNGFTFIGGHPMAGTQYSGIKNAKDNMFKTATFVLVPKQGEDVTVLGKARDVIIDIGFARINIMSAEKHDRLIAFTSQLAHVVSNAYVKSPSANEHNGISAGSYRDLTRVAYLNETMWTELFLENGDNLVRELDTLIGELSKYRDAIKANDPDTLKQLLKEGREAKERIDS